MQFEWQFIVSVQLEMQWLISHLQTLSWPKLEQDDSALVEQSKLSGSLQIGVSVQYSELQLPSSHLVLFKVHLN